VEWGLGITYDRFVAGVGAERSQVSSLGGGCCRPSFSEVATRPGQYATARALGVLGESLGGWAAPEASGRRSLAAVAPMAPAEARGGGSGVGAREEGNGTLL
jgi:hypothetical protein